MQTLPEVKHVTFHNTKIPTLKEGDTTWVAMRPVIEAMGLSWGAQQKKLSNGAGRFGCSLIAIPSAGGKQSVLCLPLTKLNIFLATINAERIPDPKIKKRVILYQEECAIALYNYWHKGAALNSRVPDILEQIAAQGTAPSARPTIQLDEVDYWKMKAELAELKLEKNTRDLIPKRRPYTAAERARIETMIQRGVAPGDIARHMGRSKDSIENLRRRIFSMRNGGAA
jgi:hypothetical protein